MEEYLRKCGARERLKLLSGKLWIKKGHLFIREEKLRYHTLICNVQTHHPQR